MEKAHMLIELYSSNGFDIPAHIAAEIAEVAYLEGAMACEKLSRTLSFEDHYTMRDRSNELMDKVMSTI